MDEVGIVGGTVMVPHVQWIDSWRGMMILLVVLWHALGAGLGGADKYCPHLASVHSFVANFHMIAFFAISGFVWKKGSAGFRQYFVKNFRRLMVPYYVFATLGAVIIAIITAAGFYSLSRADAMAEVKAILLAGRPECYAPIWFLSCLFAILIVFEGTMKISERLLFLSILPFLLAYFERCFFGSFCSIRVFNLAVIPRYLIMFILGYLLGKFLKRKYDLSCLTRIGLFAAGVLGLLLFARSNVMAVPKGLAFLIPLRSAAIIFSTLLIAVSIDNRYLAWIGKGGMTLGILCLHKWPILCFQKLPLFKGCFCGEFVTLAMVIVMMLCAVGFSVAGTLFINRHLPWMFGKTKMNLPKEV